MAVIMGETLYEASDHLLRPLCNFLAVPKPHQLTLWIERGKQEGAGRNSNRFESCRNIQSISKLMHLRDLTIAHFRPDKD